MMCLDLQSLICSQCSTSTPFLSLGESSPCSMLHSNSYLLYCSLNSQNAFMLPWITTLSALLYRVMFLCKWYRCLRWCLVELMGSVRSGKQHQTVVGGSKTCFSALDNTLQSTHRHLLLCVVLHLSSKPKNTITGNDVITSYWQCMVAL